MPLPLPARRRSVLSTDLSAFMIVILMLAGCLITLLIINLAARMADPNLIVVGTIIRAPGYQQGSNVDTRATGRVLVGNVDKKPFYIDVYPDRLQLLPGGLKLLPRDFERPGSPFQTLLDRIEPKADEQYVLLLIRPRTAAIVRGLRKAITDRGIDVGLELYETYDPINLEDIVRPQGGAGS